MAFFHKSKTFSSRLEHHSNKTSFSWLWLDLVLRCLMPFSTIFQVNRGRNREYPEKTTDLLQVTDKLYQIMLYTSPWAGFKLKTSVLIGTDNICSCKSNYNTIRQLIMLIKLFNRGFFQNIFSRSKKQDFKA